MVTFLILMCGADLALVGGKVWTGAGPDAQAVAFARGRIVAVGKDADIRALVTKATRVIELKGRRVVPGFIDSHLHVLGGGTRLAQVSLKLAADEKAFARRLKEFDAKLPKGRWMLGGDWDHDRTFGGRLPDAAMIDKYVPGRPVFLRRYDGHMALANTAALKEAGVTARTADPPGGVIVRKAGTREPTGLLRDNAMSLVDAVVPRPDASEVAEAVRAALAELAKEGITSAVDMDGSDDATRALLFRLYQRLAREGKLTCRVDLRWPLARWKALADLGVEAGFGGQWVRIGGLKGFADGSLGSSTARMNEAYLHEKGNTGVWVTTPARLREWVTAADAAGLAVCVHAIGDLANEEMLTIFAEAAKKNGPRASRRFRIEHAQHLRPADYRRFAETGVIASMQPYHIIDDGRWAEGRIGAKRCESSYACRSLIDAGARLAFGSDWSVAPLSPLLGIDAAVHRRTLDGKHKGGWFPMQRITAREALTAYTLGSAYAMGREKDLGTIEAGKLGDVVVLTRDILADGADIAAAKVAVTISGGRVVFEAE